MSAADFYRNQRVCQTGRLQMALRERPAGATLPELCALAAIDTRAARRGLAALRRYELVAATTTYKIAR